MPSLQPKQLILGDDCRSAILKGVNAVADVVAATLGPAGRSVLLDQGPFREPRSSRDGVTVAKTISLADPIANLAAQLMIAAARKAGDSAGDGTTTATVLTQAIFREGHRLVTAGANPTLLKRGIDQAAQAICGQRDDQNRWQGGTLSSLTIPLASPEQLAQVGTLSANSDPLIGEMIAAAMAQVGREGTVTVEESQGMETTLEVVEGMQFPQGYLSPYFQTDPERGECVLTGDDTHPLFIYLHEKRLTSLHDLVPLLDTVIGPRPGSSILVIAEDVTDSALGLLVVNRVQGRLRCCAVKGPGFGDRRRQLFEDLAVLTGATLISPELGLKPSSIDQEFLGRATRVTVTKDDCTLVGGQGNPDLLEARRQDLRHEIERCQSDFDRQRLEERLAKLTGGVAVVKVGGQTEAEMKERKDRAEDAMYATKAAAQEGIVPGGGVALLRATLSSDFIWSTDDSTTHDERSGWRIVAKACAEPLRRIVQNAGGEGGEVVAELRRRIAAGASPEFGYNAATSRFEDLLAAGVVDPVRVTRTALLAASSIAGLLLTNEAIVADDIEAAGAVRRAIAPVMPGQPGMPLQY